MAKLSKGLSLLIVLAAYTAAFFVGLAVYALMPGLPIWRFLGADAAATVVIYVLSLIFKNSSLYDPYWSIAPSVLFICFVWDKGYANTSDMLLLAVLLFWGLRLTINWIIGWRGMAHQDWRYTMLRQKNPKIWQLVNFFGIMLMPTLIVFANMVPAYYSALSHGHLNLLSVLGAAVCAAAVLLQIFSDAQMRRFRLSNDSGRHIETGLWKYSRHPNYLGEVSFWWGIYIIQLGAATDRWWTLFAPVLMTLLFLFISIPMMEERLMATKQGYADYKKRTSMMLLLPRKKA